MVSFANISSWFYSRHPWLVTTYGVILTVLVIYKLRVAPVQCLKAVRRLSFFLSCSITQIWQIWQMFSACYLGWSVIDFPDIVRSIIMLLLPAVGLLILVGVLLIIAALSDNVNIAAHAARRLDTIFTILGYFFFAWSVLANLFFAYRAMTAYSFKPALLRAFFSNPWAFLH